MKSQKGLQKEHSVSYELWSIKGVPLKPSGIATGDFENVSWFNPFTPKISIIINSNSVFSLPYNSYDVSLENFLYSHHFSAWYCILRRKSVLVIQGSLRVKALLLIVWLIFKSIRRKFYSHMTLIMIISLSKFSPWEQYFSGLPYLQTSPFYFSLQMQKEEDRKFLSRKLLHLLEVSCGFSADVTTLLLDTTRKSFVFEDELNDTME